MAKKEEFMKIDFHKKSVLMGIWVVGFADHGQQIAYTPSLKLSGYGDSKDEAIDMLFRDVVNDMFDNLFKLTESDFTKELAKYGWKRGAILRKKFYNSQAIDKKGILKDFNLPEETQITQDYIQPVAA